MKTVTLRARPRIPSIAGRDISAIYRRRIGHCMHLTKRMPALHQISDNAFSCIVSEGDNRSYDHNRLIARSLRKSPHSQESDFDLLAGLLSRLVSDHGVNPGTCVMSEEAETTLRSMGAIVADLVAAYVSNNRVPSSDLPALIANVRDAVARLGTPGAEAAPEVAPKPTAAQIRKSIQHGGIVSFLDGRSYKTLKRHLATYGLNPETYRERFGLRDDYPMVAPAYSERRSQLAKDLGLGIRGGPAAPKAVQVVSARKRRQAA